MERGRPHLSVSIADHPVDALIDTGSSFTLIDENLNGIKLNKDKRGLHRVRTATGEMVSLSGPCEIKIDDRLATVYITKGINRGIPILGTDFLQDRGAKLDYVSNRVELDGQTRSIGFPESASLASIDQITSAVLRYEHLFDREGELPAMDVGVEMSIETEGPPIAQRPYRAPLAKRFIIDREIEVMLEKGIIRPSSSPWSSPVLLVPKKGTGESRFCVDLRRVNTVTKKDRYPLMRIEDIFDVMGASCVYSTLDLKSGYWQLPIREEDRAKTAFVCHQGQYEYNRVPFGLANAPAVFQRTMNKILEPVIGRCAFVYIDDIIIYSKNRGQHAKDLAQVFDLLDQHRLTLKRVKCVFGQAEVEVLGFNVSKDGISPILSKTQAITALDPPASVREVRMFMGMVNYYRRVIPRYSEYSHVLTNLTKKNTPFEWTARCDVAFQGLKKALTSAKVMAYPQVNKPFKLFTDACDYAVGAILVQDDDDGVERPIHYLSHQLTDVQRRWATIEKEAYAIIYALTKLRPYLYGADFTIYTDQKPLRSLFSSEMHNTKIQRWAIMIAEYGAKIEYRKGKHNVRADMLSRIKPSENRLAGLGPADAKPAINSNENIYGLNKLELRGSQRTEFGPEWDEALTGESLDYSIEDDLLVSDSLPHPGAQYDDRIILPSGYRERAIQDAHEAVGHMATNKTMRRIAERYVWSGMRRDVRDYIKACATCQLHTRTKIRVPLGEMPLPHSPQEIIGLDFIGPYTPPTSEGYRYVLIIVDHFTGWVEAFPTKGIEVVTREYLTRYSTPRMIINDNGQGFGSGAWSTYCEQNGIRLVRTTPVHPQGNGKTERANRTYKEILGKLVGNKPNEWYRHLSMAAGAMRRAVSETTGFSPHYLTYGLPELPPRDRFLQEGQEPFGNRLDDLAEAYKEARVRTEKMREGNKRRVDERANVNPSLAVGSHVVLKAEERLTNTARWDPGFIVTRVEGTTHWVTNPQTGVNKRVHREKVRLVTANESLRNMIPRPRRKHKLRSKTDVKPPKIKQDVVVDKVEPEIKRRSQRNVGRGRINYAE